MRKSLVSRPFSLLNKPSTRCLCASNLVRGVICAGPDRGSGRGRGARGKARGADRRILLRTCTYDNVLAGLLTVVESDPVSVQWSMRTSYYRRQHVFEVIPMTNRGKDGVWGQMNDGVLSSRSVWSARPSRGVFACLDQMYSSSGNRGWQLWFARGLGRKLEGGGGKKALRVLTRLHFVLIQEQLLLSSVSFIFHPHRVDAVP